MKIRSLRSRLLITYAGVALLTAVVLGIALLSILRDFYRRRETVYLQESASSAVSALFEGFFMPEQVPDYASLLNNLSSTTQTRMRLLDHQGGVLADTGSPAPDGTNLLPVSPTNSKLSVMMGQSMTVADENSGTLQTSMMATYKFTLFGAPSRSDLRSKQIYTVDLQIPSMPDLAALELSEAPAFGSEVIGSVIWGWLISSLLAVLVAGLAGWLASRQISAPLISLTNATGQIAEGNLAARAGLERLDEIGQLARTFDSMAVHMESLVDGLKRFVSDAAHEIQTPLTALQTNLELALDEPDPAKKEAVILRAQSVAGRLSSLTRSLLDLARLEAQAHPFTTERINLAELASSLYETYSASIEQAGLTCRLELPIEPVWILAHLPSLERAAGNLVENAIKFTPEGGSVAIRAGRESGLACLAVEDTGIGIPDAELEHVFDRFHRAGNSAGYPGSGLGLAISKKIVESHAGNLSACNLADGGACFTISLPLAVD